MKTEQRIRADQVQVGDMLNLSSSMDPSEAFHRVTEVVTTKPHQPIPGASKACTILISMGKYRKLHVPPDVTLRIKR